MLQQLLGQGCCIGWQLLCGTGKRGCCVAVAACQRGSRQLEKRLQEQLSIYAASSPRKLLGCLAAGRQRGSHLVRNQHGAALLHGLQQRRKMACVLAAGARPNPQQQGLQRRCGFLLACQQGRQRGGQQLRVGAARLPAPLVVKQQRLHKRQLHLPGRHSKLCCQLQRLLQLPPCRCLAQLPPRGAPGGGRLSGFGD